jgi:hypothetical protein
MAHPCYSDPPRCQPFISINDGQTHPLAKWLFASPSSLSYCNSMSQLRKAMSGRPMNLLLVFCNLAEGRGWTLA